MRNSISGLRLHIADEGDTIPTGWIGDWKMTMLTNTFAFIDAHSFTLAFGLPGHGEWIILLILGLLIFGRRLPEVGRSLGRGIVEFKKGIRGVTDDIEDEIDEQSSPKPKKRISRSSDDSPSMESDDEESEEAVAVGKGDSAEK